MPTAGLAPLDEAITIEELTRDPYPIYKRLNAKRPYCGSNPWAAPSSPRPPTPST